LDERTPVMNGLDAKCSSSCGDPLYDDSDGDGVCSPANCTDRISDENVCGNFILIYTYIYAYL
jgi:hypothetical protein